MGALFSREKTDSKDFEKILSQLDADIQKTETRLSEIKIRQRRISFMWILYSLIIWVLCVIYLFYKVNQSESTTQDISYVIAPILLLPVGIYYIRKALILWFDRQQKKQESNLMTLRNKQKSKLEELKKKTSYYTTQSLLERYDEATDKKKKEALLKQQQQQQQEQFGQRKPVSMPMRPFNPQHTLPTPSTNSQQQQQQQSRQAFPQQQSMLPPPQTRSEPQWYDKIVDALVGDAGPETKYALICAHCFNHNGLVLKEEFDTIQYVCPNCKQFNPSRNSKKVIAIQPEHHDEEVVISHDEKAKGSHDHDNGDKLTLKDQESVEQDNEQEETEEKEKEAVLAKLKAEYATDNEDENTIGARVRHRRTNNSKE